MPVHIVEQFKAYLPPEVVHRIALLFGEQATKTQKAIEEAIPSLIGGLIHMAETPEGSKRLSELLQDGQYPTSLLSDIPQSVQEEMKARGLIKHGRSLLRHVLGGQQRADRMVNEIAKSSGIRNFSSLSLTSLLAPWTLALLQREVGGTNPLALTGYLVSQKNALLPLLPASLVGLLGLNQIMAPVSAASVPMTTNVVATGNTILKRFGLPALFIGFILTALVLYAPFGSLQAIKPIARPLVSAHQADELSTRTKQVMLPDGVRLDLMAGTINYAVSEFLASNTTTTPKTFVFDNLNFEFGNTVLTPESKKTVQDLVAILKAYPNAAVALEGHTDNVGSVLHNKALSLRRANAVKSQLVAAGIVGTRIVHTEGFGPDKPIGDNTTEEGRAKNRRLELVIVKK
ncbi:MAG TPA: OmpA family protein [Rhodothermales bacterium]|nr:OmpA family protein [Rhodothermales bacterium]